jgi:hypothetical protein
MTSKIAELGNLAGGIEQVLQRTGTVNDPSAGERNDWR